MDLKYIYLMQSSNNNNMFYLHSAFPELKDALQMRQTVVQIEQNIKQNKKMLYEK